MRAVFGVLSLLLVVAVVGILVKKQVTSVAAPAPASAPVAGMPAQPPASPQQQVNQIRQAVEGALQQPRPAAAEQ